MNTLAGGLLRRVPVPSYRRERLELEDGDFLDLDWLEEGGGRLVILSHGLEGSSRRVYMSGMARALATKGFDVLAWNYRGCSGEPNRLLRSYHSGATEDLAAVVAHAAIRYESISLVGFSLGGNMTLKYLGECGDRTRAERAVVFSVPCDLASSSRYLARLPARPYMARFMRSLRDKVREKAEMFPGQVPLDGLDRMGTFAEFDEAYTAPWNGFLGAEDYWARASSLPYLQQIRRPTLMVQAWDDPFLPPACYPHREAEGSAYLSLLTTRHGGHVGFIGTGGSAWSEGVACEFLERSA